MKVNSENKHYNINSIKIKKGKTNSVSDFSTSYKEIIFPDQDDYSKSESKMFKNSAFSLKSKNDNYKKVFMKLNKTNKQDSVVSLPKIEHNYAMTKVPFVGNIKHKIQQKIILNSKHKRFNSTHFQESNYNNNNNHYFNQKEEEEENISNNNDNLSDLNNNVPEENNLKDFAIKIIKKNTINDNLKKVIFRKQNSIFDINMERSTDSEIVDYHKINVIKSNFFTMKRSQSMKDIDIINDIYRKVEAKKKINDPKYREIKEIFKQVELEQIINTKDSAICNQLYLINKNPFFEINNNISFPFILKDSVFLSEVFKINMQKLNNVRERFMKYEVKK
jgi:hypothetical protein